MAELHRADRYDRLADGVERGPADERWAFGSACRFTRIRSGAVDNEPFTIQIDSARGWPLSFAHHSLAQSWRHAAMRRRRTPEPAGCPLVARVVVNAIRWAADPVMFSLGQAQITWYAFLFVMGLIGGYLLAALALRADGYDILYANLLLIFVAVGAVVGARLGEIVFYDWSYYRARPGDILKIWQGGLASHGAAVGIPLMLGLYARVIVRRPFLWVLDRAVCGIAFGAACVRFGNLMNSEILGKSTSVPWAIVFERVDRIPRHPVQLYEGIWYLALTFGLLMLRPRWQPRLGVLSGLFLIGMFVPRLFLEFTKDSPGIFAGLNTGQLLSLPFIAMGVLFLVWSGWRTPEPVRVGPVAAEGVGDARRGSQGRSKRRRAR